MTTLTVAEQMLYSTAKLTALKGGKAASTGTGFFFKFSIDKERDAIAIITNNHVINGNEAINVTYHLAEGNGPSGRHITLAMDLHPNRIVRHPDPNIDLCVILFGDIVNNAHARQTPLFIVPLDPSLIPKDDEWNDFDAIEEVTMIGCPNGISDETNNLPISRKGITASSLAKNYNGKREFMVDMACFPGSSGSPVFVFDRNGYLDRKTNNYMMGVTRIKLVGILYAGPLITNTGAIVLGQTPTVQVAAMMHLGNVIKSSEITILEPLIKKKILNN